MVTEHPTATRSCPGTLVRKRRTWPPSNAVQHVEPPKFTSHMPWQPRSWERVRTVAVLGRE